MAHSEPARIAPSHAVPRLGLTIYGCGPEEAVLFRQIAPRVGVVPTITEAHLSEATAELAAGSHCVSVGHRARIANGALRALSLAGVTHLSTRSIGYDHIDVKYASSVGISVDTVAYSPASVADYTLMLMLMLIRRAKSVIRRAEMHDYRLSHVPGKELRDLTVGVIGTGRIGTAVMDRLLGFGCRLLACDDRPSTRAGAQYVSLHALFQRSDVVTLHAPLTPGTHHLLNRERLGQMKAGAFIVNTGRGSLLDTEALTEALESGRLGGAALDVLEGEEGIFYVDCSDEPGERKPFVRLHRLPNVIISPHSAYYTDHALKDIVENTLRNCLDSVGRWAWSG